jgi:general secretion pathway protein A
MSHQSPSHAVAVGHDEYYGFSEAPFSLTPNPKFAYSSESHERALRTILHALSRHEGLLLITGDIGCGKTTLCRRLMPLLPERTFLSLVLNPFLTPEDLLKQVLEDFGLVSANDSRLGPAARASCHELARTLQEFLYSLAKIDGTAVIIVDEAQNLPLRTLEQIRLLSNFETDNRKLLQIILVGQKNLEPILELDELRQLNQRISRRCRIEPLRPSEVAAYVEHRLRAAMPENVLPRVRFTAAAFAAVARLSHGVPRIINLLCDRGLELGAANEAHLIDRRGVLSSAADLGLPIPVQMRLAPAMPTGRSIRAAAAAAATVAAIAVGATAIRSNWLPWSSASPAARGSTAETTVPKSSLQLEPALNPRAPNDSPAADIPQPTKSPEGKTEILQSAPAYELAVASFETVSRASAVAAELVGEGHPARVATSASGRWQMVLVGPYSSFTEATEAKAVLERSGFSAIRITSSR